MVWKRDNRRPTPKEVAEYVGCSAGYASRVMQMVDSKLAEMERKEAEERIVHHLFCKFPACRGRHSA
jgi:hypothetical protein